MEPLTERIIIELNRFRDLVPAEGWQARMDGWCKERHVHRCPLFSLQIREHGHRPCSLPQELGDEYPPPDWGL